MGWVCFPATCLDNWQCLQAMAPAGERRDSCLCFAALDMLATLHTPHPRRLPTADNHPPFEDAPRLGDKASGGMPCTLCTHPTCRHSVGAAAASVLLPWCGVHRGAWCCHLGGGSAPAKAGRASRLGAVPSRTPTLPTRSRPPLLPLQPARMGVAPCPACEGEAAGTLVLDPVSAPAWRLDCSRCSFLICEWRLPALLESLWGAGLLVILPVAPALGTAAQPQHISHWSAWPLVHHQHPEPSLLK